MSTQARDEKETLVDDTSESSTDSDSPQRESTVQNSNSTRADIRSAKPSMIKVPVPLRAKSSTHIASAKVNDSEQEETVTPSASSLSFNPSHPDPGPPVSVPSGPGKHSFLGSDATILFGNGQLLFRPSMHSAFHPNAHVAPDNKTPAQPATSVMSAPVVAMPAAVSGPTPQHPFNPSASIAPDQAALLQMLQMSSMPTPGLGQGYPGHAPAFRSRFPVPVPMAPGMFQVPGMLPFPGAWPDTSGFSKPFHCTLPGCTKSFTDHSNAKRHKLTHLDFKPFKCVRCDRRFSRRASGLSHIVRIHGQSKDSRAYQEMASQAVNLPDDEEVDRRLQKLGRSQHQLNS